MAPASVSGPITGGARGRPYGEALVDLTANGYVEEEFFFDGEASAYGLAAGADTTLPDDGRWDVIETDRAEYATRLLVRRPTDPERSVSPTWDIPAMSPAITGRRLTCCRWICPRRLSGRMS